MAFAPYIRCTAALSLALFTTTFTTTTNTPAEQALLDDLANMLLKGGSTVTVVPEIQRKKFAKNFWNVGFSSFATLTGYTVPALFRPPPGEGQERYAPYVWPQTKGEIEEYTIGALKGVLGELVELGE